MADFIVKISKRHLWLGYAIYLFISITAIDFLLANVFYKKLSTHERYYAVTHRCKNPYFHHGLRKNVESTDEYRGIINKICTNSIGFKDAHPREIATEYAGKRIILIGDSFTEGVGLPYEKTFAGVIADNLKKQNIEVLNAGVSTYSPKLYYLKTRYIIEKLKLKFDKLFVFIDMSDIEDEIVYKSFIPVDKELNDIFSYYARLYIVKYSAIGNTLDRFIQNKWPRKLDPDAQTRLNIINENGGETNWKYNISGWYTDDNYAKWGSEGYASAKYYMSELIKLCKDNKIEMAIAVYPWPRQVDENDAENRHVIAWKKFSRMHGVHFINFYPLFMTSDPDKVINKNFIPNDIHYNESGNMLIARGFLKWYNLNHSKGSQELSALEMRQK